MSDGLADHFGGWGAYCREHGDRLLGIEGADGPYRPLGKQCPNCDQDRWFVVPMPDDEEWSAGHYCRCCAFMWPVWREA